MVQKKPDTGSTQPVPVRNIPETTPDPNLYMKAPKRRAEKFLPPAPTAPALDLDLGPTIRQTQDQVSKRLNKIVNFKLPTDIKVAFAEADIDFEEDAVGKVAYDLSQQYDLPASMYYLPQRLAEAGFVPVYSEDTPLTDQMWINPLTGQEFSGQEGAVQFQVEELLFWRHYVEEMQGDETVPLPKRGVNVAWDDPQQTKHIFDITVSHLGNIEDVGFQEILSAAAAASSMFTDPMQVGRYQKNLEYLTDNIPGLGKTYAMSLAASAAVFPVSGQVENGVLDNPAQVMLLYSQMYDPDRAPEVLRQYTEALKESDASGPIAARGRVDTERITELRISDENAAGHDYLKGLMEGKQTVDDYFFKAYERAMQKKNWADDLRGSIAGGWDAFKRWDIPLSDMQVGDWTGGLAEGLGVAGENLYNTINWLVYQGQTGITGIAGLAATPFTDETLEDLGEWAHNRNIMASYMLRGETTLSERWDAETEGTILEFIPRPVWFLAELVPQLVIDPFVVIGRGIKLSNSLRTLQGALKHSDIEKTVATAVRGWKRAGRSSEEIKIFSDTLRKTLRGKVISNYTARAAATFGSANKKLGGRSIARWLIDEALDAENGATLFRRAAARLKFLTKKNSGSLVTLERIHDLIKGLKAGGKTADEIEPVIVELLVGLAGGVPGKGTLPELRKILSELQEAKLAHGKALEPLAASGALLPEELDSIRAGIPKLFAKGAGGHTLENTILDIIDMLPPTAGAIDGEKLLRESLEALARKLPGAEDVRALDEAIEFSEDYRAYEQIFIDTVERRIIDNAGGEIPRIMGRGVEGNFFGEIPRLRRTPRLRDMVSMHLSPARALAWNALWSKVPSMMINVERGFSDRLREILRLTGNFSEKEIDEIVAEGVRLTSRHIPRREQNFVNYVKNIEERILRAEAERWGYSPEQAGQILKSLKKTMDENRAMLFGVSVDDLAEAGGNVDKLMRIIKQKGLNRPQLATQLVNQWLMTNPLAIRKAFQQAAGMRQEVVSLIARHMGKAVPPATIKSIHPEIIARNIATSAMDTYLRLWKPATIISGRYIFRVVGDEMLRTIADIGVVERVMASKLYRNMALRMGYMPRTQFYTASPAHLRWLDKMARKAGFGDNSNLGNAYQAYMANGSALREVYGAVMARKYFGVSDEFTKRLDDLDPKVLEAVERSVDESRLADALVEEITPEKLRTWYDQNPSYRKAFGHGGQYGNTIPGLDNINVSLTDSEVAPGAHPLEFFRTRAEGDLLPGLTKEQSITNTIEHEINHQAFAEIFGIGTGVPPENLDLFNSFMAAMWKHYSDKIAITGGKLDVFKGAHGPEGLYIDDINKLNRPLLPEQNGEFHFAANQESIDPSATAGQIDQYRIMTETFADAWLYYHINPQFLQDSAWSIYKWIDDNYAALEAGYNAAKRRINVTFITRDVPEDGVAKFLYTRGFAADVAENPNALSGHNVIDYYLTLTQREKRTLEGLTRGKQGEARSFGVIYPAEDDWAGAGAKLLQRDWGQDLIGQRILLALRDGDNLDQEIDSIVKWLFHTEDGMQYRSRMPGWPNDEVVIRDGIADLATRINGVVGGRPDIADGALKGLDWRVLKKGLDEIPQEARGPIHGVRADMVFGDSNPFGTMFDTLARYVFEMPTNKLVRHPYYAANYRRIENALLEAMDGAGITLDEAAERAIHNASREFAANRTVDIMFDFRRQSRFAEMSRFVAPFLQPYSEAISVWSHLLRQNPAFAAHAYLFNRASLANDSMLHTDPVTGEQRVSLTNWMLGGALLNAAFGGAPNTPGWTLSAPLRSFNFLFGSIFDLPLGENGKWGSIPIPVPSFSPPMTWLMQKLATSDIVPDHLKFSVFQWAYQYGSLDSPFKFAQGMLPTYMGHIVDSFLPESDMIDSLSTDFARLYEGRGITPASYAEERGITVAKAERELGQMAEAQARDLLRHRAWMSFMFPTAPTIHFPQQEVENEWRNLVKAKIAEDPVNGYTEAKELFLDKYPEWSYITVGTATWEQISPVQIPATELIDRLMLDPGMAEFAKKYPRWFFALIPEEYYDDEFSREAYFRQIDLGWRGSLNAIEMYQKGDVRQGWEAWEGLNEQWTLIQEQMESDKIVQSSLTWQNAERDYNNVLDSLKNLYPGFADQFDRFSNQGINPMVFNELVKMTQVPMFRKTSVGQAAIKWLALYKETDQKLSDLNISNITSSTAERYGISGDYEERLQEIFLEHPQWEQVYNTLFDTALRDVTTKADQILDALDPEQERYFQEWDSRWGQLIYESNSGALNLGESAQAYQAMRDMSAQTWLSFPDRATNPQWIWWETRTPKEQEDYMVSVSLRPFAFLSRFDLELLGIPANSDTDKAWSEIGNMQAQISLLRAAGQTSGLSPLYDAIDELIQFNAQADPVFAQQVERANTWGANLAQVILNDDNTYSDAAWREVFSTLAQLQQTASLLELHGIDDPNPINSARYAELRIVLEQNVRQLKDESPAFKTEWEELESRPGFLIESLIPDSYFPLGVI